MGPHTTGSSDYQYMYDLPDLMPHHPANPLQVSKGNSGTVLSLIRNNPDFSIFSYIVGFARMDGMLDDPQFNGTVFVPSDSYLESMDFPRAIIENLRRSTARAIVEYSILQERITESVLRSSPVSHYMTRYNPCKRLLIENMRGVTTLQANGDITVVHYNALLSNGIIHVIDNLLVPEVVI